MLKEKIHLIQQGDKQTLDVLFRQFEPLVRKYGRRLGDEDGYQDMALCLIVILRQINLDKLRHNADAVIINYISRSMYHQYIHYAAARNYQRQKEMPLETALTGYNEELPDDSFDALLERAGLSVSEAEVLRLLYQKGLSAIDVAQRRHTSKQNIYQIRRRALRKIRRTL